MKVVTSFPQARAAGVGSVGLVPTMGYLHEGHLSLAQLARATSDTVTMSLFVNPLQFGEGEDLSSYPRDFERDAAVAESVGVDVLFAPSESDMYPVRPVTRVAVAGLSDRMDGASRPGHFAGMATVVAKLLAGIAPARAYFGRKDAQQLAVIRRMVLDLSFPVEIVGAPIVRDPSGLALSSRNSYLTGDEREAATALSRGLYLASDAVDAGVRSARELENIAFSAMAEAAGVEPEYAVLAGATDVAPLEMLDRDGFLAVAAVVGSTRLIDNVHFDLVAGSVVADLGVVLETPSALSTANHPDTKET